MPILDVSELLTDPDFCQQVVLTTSAITVNTNGIASKTTESSTITAVVTPLTTRELLRLPEGELLRGGITVFSQSPMKTGSGQQSADTIVWNGVGYLVYSVDDYSSYGGGYYVAVCQLLSVRG